MSNSKLTPKFTPAVLITAAALMAGAPAMAQHQGGAKAGPHSIGAPQSGPNAGVLLGALAAVVLVGAVVAGGRK
jgi:hypothetical protein